MSSLNPEHLKKLEALLNAGSADQAVALLAQLQKAFPHEPRLDFFEARLLLLQEKPQKALDILKRLSKKKMPQNWVNLINSGLVQAYMAQGNNQLAVKPAQAIYKADPTNVFAVRSLCLLYNVLKRYGDLAKLGGKIKQLLPQELPLQLCLAAAYHLTGAYDKARALIEQIAKRQMTVKQFEQTASLHSYALRLFFHYGQWQSAWINMSGRHLLGQQIGTAVDLKLPIPNTPDQLASKIAVVWEQGFGNNLIQSRFGVALDEGHGVQTRLVLPPRLMALMERSLPGLPILEQDVTDWGADQMIYSSDLPWFMGADSLPPEVRLKPCPEQAAYFDEKYRKLFGDKKRLGLTWRSLSEQNGEEKSIKLERLLKLLEGEDWVLFNLQYGDVSDEVKSVLAHYPNISWYTDEEVDQYGDFDPVAAQLSVMDGLWSISSTIVHLAGGLGVPTALLVQDHGYKNLLWYWSPMDRENWPYQSVEHFHTLKTGDWNAALKASKAWLSDQFDKS